MTDENASANPGWGSAQGFVKTRRPDETDASDRELVVETIHRYGWAYDERDLDELGTVFSADAVWKGFVAGAPIPPLEGRQAIVDWLAGIMDVQEDQRRHIVINPVVQALDATSAHVITYLIVTSVLNGGVTISTSGFYDVELQRSGGGAWEITSMIAGFDVPF